MKIIIPARAQSSGLPYKNRKLFSYTAKIIPRDFASDTYVFSDDAVISGFSKYYGFNNIPRPPRVSTDSISTKDSMKYCLDSLNLIDESIIMLYLTYPERTWKDVQRAIHMFNEYGASSLLCRKEISTSPYLMLKSEDDHKGSKLFNHDLYRRQDYPECFEISHFISIFKSGDINNLGQNMYNSDTIFMPISATTIDVDTQKDLDNLNGNNNR